MKRQVLVDFLDYYLRISEISDYGPQGLQVESANEGVERLALAVDAAPPVIKAAAEWHADMLLVHHGILWRNVEPIAGPLGVRVRMLLENNISLYAAHLPLDAHPEVGNNAVLARQLGVTVDSWWCEPTGTPIAVLGSFSGPTSLVELVQRTEELLGTRARVLAHGPEFVSKVAIISGFGADEVSEAHALDADTLLTGETSHSNYWLASDYRMNVIYGGHYATETVGVKALGELLAAKYQLDVRFLDFPTNM